MMVTHSNCLRAYKQPTRSRKEPLHLHRESSYTNVIGIAFSVDDNEKKGFGIPSIYLPGLVEESKGKSVSSARTPDASEFFSTLHNRLDTFRNASTHVKFMIWTDSSNKSHRLSDQIIKASKGTSWQIVNYIPKTADPQFFADGPMVIEVNEPALSATDHGYEAAVFLRDELKPFGIEALVKPSPNKLEENFLRLKISSD